MPQTLASPCAAGDALPTIPAGGQGTANARASSATKSLQVDLVILLHSPAFTLVGNACATRGMQKTSPPLASDSSLNCFSRRPCSASSAQDRVSLRVEFMTRKTGGKPQLGVHRAGDNGIGRRADLIDFKIRSRFDGFPSAQHSFHGVQCRIRDLVDLNRRGSPDHPCQGRQRA